MTGRAIIYLALDIDAERLIAMAAMEEHARLLAEEDARRADENARRADAADAAGERARTEQANISDVGPGRYCLPLHRHAS